MSRRIDRRGSGIWRNCLMVVSLALALPLWPQTIPAERTTDWSKAGFLFEPPGPVQELDITAFGAVGDGITSCNAAFNAAVAEAAGEMTVIHFPAGTYLFTASINVPDRIILRGDGAGLTTLTFSIGGIGHCIRIAGQALPTTHPLVAPAIRGDTSIQAFVTEDLEPGDVIRLYRNDSDLVVSPWAIGTAGQIAHVAFAGSVTVQLHSPLRANYEQEGSYLRKLDPVMFVGIECLKIVRQDQTAGQWSNIWMIRASHCWVRGVESDMANFAHIEISESTNCEITGNYLHHAFDYGTGGKAYGVNLTNTSCEILVQDNIFEHLRHSMIVQIGANGNVLAYNFSTDPYWDQAPLPANTAGEIVLHGDHPYLNLIESNSVQNIVIDDSHGINGPFNTLFRNRAAGYGLFMSNAPATDSVNIVGNEISGYLITQGTGHFSYGNTYQGNTIPPGTDDLSDVSYYLDIVPGFLSNTAPPQIGPNADSPGTIPAAQRFLAGEDPTVCANDIGTSFMEAIPAAPINIHPNPFTDRIVIDGSKLSTGMSSIELYDPTGRSVYRGRITNASRMSIEGLQDLRSGAYLLEVIDGSGVVFRSVVVKD